MDYHTLVSLYDAYRDAVSELEHACERFNQAVIDMHSYDISLIGTAEQLRELFRGLAGDRVAPCAERCKRHAVFV